MKSAGLLAAIIITGIASTAVARLSDSVCENREIPYKFGPLTDQADSKLCFARTSADLLSEATGASALHFLSAFDGAVTHNTATQAELDRAIGSIRVRYDSTDEPIKSYSKFGTDIRLVERVNRGGRPDVAMQLLVNRGYACQENDVPSFNKSGLKDENADFVSKRLEKALRDDNSSSTQNIHTTSYLCSSNASNVERIKKLTPAISDWGASKLKSVLAKECINHVRLSGLYVNSAAFMDPASPQNSKESMKQIDDLLKRDRPFGLSVDSSVIWKNSRGPHSVTVIGRKWNPQQNTCEWHIRNTIMDCTKLQVGIRCDPDGTMWISHKGIEQSAHEIFWIEKHN